MLSIDDLTVESFTTSDLTQESEAVGIVDTGCVSDCATGCGFGGSIC
jgi:hypothetical protein